ncbi:hypothetical protein CMI37_29360 [Candidatus Pacearchaeota archaeon]|jgi:predicted DNA-binding protein|nr:hypothetical protein [Candidatus Pacearchaeota archaeon]|tara:strand:- start:3492 stop:3713 length:222 start_codon:yes stop_codon:yes gene_type:complete
MNKELQDTLKNIMKSTSKEITELENEIEKLEEEIEDRHLQVEILRLSAEGKDIPDNLCCKMKKKPHLHWELKL